MQVSQNFWLSIWSEKTLEWQDAQDDPHGAAGDAAGGGALAPAVADIGRTAAFPTHFYMTVYFGLGICSLVFQASRAVTLVLSTLQASQVRLPGTGIGLLYVWVACIVCAGYSCAHWAQCVYTLLCACIVCGPRRTVMLVPRTL